MNRLGPIHRGQGEEEGLTSMTPHAHFWHGSISMFLDGGPLGISASLAAAPRKTNATSNVPITFMLSSLAKLLRRRSFSR